MSIDRGSLGVSRETTFKVRFSYFGQARHKSRPDSPSVNGRTDVASNMFETVCAVLSQHHTPYRQATFLLPVVFQNVPSLSYQHIVDRNMY